MKRIPYSMHAPAGQRGYMLVIALLVMLTLASVGTLAVQNITQEIAYTGNARQGAVAYRVTEGGAFTSVAYAQGLGAAGLTSVYSATADDATSVGTYATSVWKANTMVDSTLSYFDMTKYGSFGYEGALQGAAAAMDAASGTIWSPAEFEIRVQNTGLRQPILGYSFTGPGGQCRFKYQFDAVGNVGQPSPSAASDAGMRAWQRIRAMMYVGPLPCNQASSSFGGTG